MQVATPLLCAGAASCPCCALPVSSTQPVALKAQTWRLKERWFVFPASDPLAACRGRLVLRAEHRFINTSALQVVPAARLAPSLRPGALPVPRGLAGSWQDPAASWRGSSACSQCGGVAAWQDHSVAGSQCGRDHSVAVGTSAVTGLGDNGNQEAAELLPCLAAWDPLGILRWPKPQCLFFLLGGWQSGQSTQTLLSWAPGLGHSHHP